MRDVFSEISLTTVEKFKFARYVIIRKTMSWDIWNAGRKTAGCYIIRVIPPE